MLYFTFFLYVFSVHWGGGMGSADVLLLQVLVFLQERSSISASTVDSAIPSREMIEWFAQCDRADEWMSCVGLGKKKTSAT